MKVINNMDYEKMYNEKCKELKDLEEEMIELYEDVLYSNSSDGHQLALAVLRGILYRKFNHEIA